MEYADLHTTGNSNTETDDEGKDTDTYTVTLPTAANGEYTIAPVDGYSATGIADGGEFKFTVTPTTGYKIDEVKAGTNTLTATDGVYTITVTANTTIEVDASTT
jgi:hypothetical protein